MFDRTVALHTLLGKERANGGLPRMAESLGNLGIVRGNGRIFLGENHPAENESAPHQKQSEECSRLHGVDAGAGWKVEEEATIVP